MARGSDPGSFQITAPALGPRAGEPLCVPFKSAVCIFQSPQGLPKVSTTGLQNQLSGASSFPCRILGLGRLMWGPVPSALEENLCSYNCSPVYGLLTQGHGSPLYSNSTPPTCLVVTPSLYFMEGLFWQVLVFLINSVSVNSFNFGVSLRGGGFTNSCEKKRREKPRRKGKIFPFECRVPKNSKER